METVEKQTHKQANKNKQVPEWSSKVGCPTDCEYAEIVGQDKGPSQLE